MPAGRVLMLLGLCVVLGEALGRQCIPLADIVLVLDMLWHVIRLVVYSTVVGRHTGRCGRCCDGIPILGCPAYTLTTKPPKRCTMLSCYNK